MVKANQKVRIQTETCETNFLVVPQLCGQTDSGLAENSLLFITVFPSWVLKKVNVELEWAVFQCGREPASHPPKTAVSRCAIRHSRGMYVLLVLSYVGSGFLLCK